MDGTRARSTEDVTLVQSVDRAARILEILAEEGTAAISEIARSLQVHRSTAFRLLATLEAHDLVEQIERRGEYRVGLGALRLGSVVSARIDVSREAQDCCDRVVRQLNETANVAILGDDTAINITQSMSTQRVAVFRQYVGERTPLHATSTGKILLAHAPAELQRRIAEGPLQKFTAATITSTARLRGELDAIRSNGWAASNQEWEEGTSAVAVPVRGRGNEMVAALSITAPSFRLPEPSFPDVAAALDIEAKALSHRLGEVPTAATQHDGR